MCWFGVYVYLLLLLLPKCLLQEVLLKRHRAGRRILVMGTRIEHMEYMHRELHRCGVDAGIIVGTHSDGSKLSVDDQNEQKTKCILIASIAIVSKALNIPELDTLVVLSGGSYVNDTFWAQAVGRITRDHATKKAPELVLIRDAYECKLQPTEDGALAGCVDAACRTLRKRSPNGFMFSTTPVDVGGGGYTVGESVPF